jgi:hypothetical protein
MRRAFVILAACNGASVPAKPGYEQDIAPILEANCIRCHSAATAVSLGDCVELDQWDDGTDSTGSCSPLLGVHSSITYPVNPQLALVPVILSSTMPKDGPALSDREKQIFKNWQADGYQKDSTNHPPTITFITPPAGGAMINTGGVTTYDIQYDVEDADGDPVTGTLAVEKSGSTTALLTAPGLTNGAHTIRLDTSTLGSGTYQVAATLDDGNGVVTITAQGTLTVPSNYNATPTVTVTSPKPGYYYYAGQTVMIGWTGNDDGASLTCDVVATLSTTTIPIASGIVETPGTPASTTWTIPSSATESPSYQIQVTVHDDGSPSLSATGASGAFTVGPMPQQVSFSTQIVPLFTSTTDGCTKTGCHGSINPQQGLDLTAAKAYADIVNVAAQQTANCATGSEMLISPGDPNHSYLITKLVGSGDCLTGSRMPKGETAYTSTKIQLFIDWTLNGAPNN